MPLYIYSGMGTIFYTANDLLVPELSECFNTHITVNYDVVMPHLVHEDVTQAVVCD